MSGSKRGRWQRDASISRYVRHLREEAAARGGEAAQTAREKLGEAQAELVKTKAAKMRGELVEAAAVEKLWVTKMKAFRARLLGIPQRVQHLSARQTVVSQQEHRTALADPAIERITLVKSARSGFTTLLTGAPRNLRRHTARVRMTARTFN